jgi:purine-nucleoside phosphorylase
VTGADRGGALERVGRAAEAVRARLGDGPAVAVVLGSGFGAVVDRLADRQVVPCSELPGWPVPRALGHRGEVARGTLGGLETFVLSGRAHRYEGHDGETLARPVRALARLGVRTLVLTNAAGGIDPALSAGDLMVIDDHIDLTGANPLIGPNDDRIGPRFPDMSEAYAPRLRACADAAATDLGLTLRHGVYLAVSGPSYETPAEIRAFASLGAAAVGMSTVPEAIAARHAGLDVLGLSVIANRAAGLGPARLDAADVVGAIERTAGDVGRLLEAVCRRLPPHR